MVGALPAAPPSLLVAASARRLRRKFRTRLAGAAALDAPVSLKRAADRRAPRVLTAAKRAFLVVRRRLRCILRPASHFLARDLRHPSWILIRALGTASYAPHRDSLHLLTQVAGRPRLRL